MKPYFLFVGILSITMGFIIGVGTESMLPELVQVPVFVAFCLLVFGMYHLILAKNEPPNRT